MKRTTSYNYEPIPNNKKVKLRKHWKTGYFEINYYVSHINNLITVISACTGLIIRAHVKMDLIILVAILFVVLIGSFLLFMMYLHREDKKYKRKYSEKSELDNCIKHDEVKTKCEECSQLL